MKCLFLTAAVTAALVSTSQAGFHVMQIEEIIGGVNGNTSAQAIQLRMRAVGQPFVSLSRVRAWNALGASPILVLDITADVSNGGVGDNILLATPAFNSLMSTVPGYAADFTITNPIPASYLSGGKVTFEDDSGFIYWAVAFGAYTGTNLAGDLTNDPNANFGAPTVALPTATAQGIRFTGLASDPSTTNAAQYALTPDPAVVRNNARNSFTVVPEPGSVALVAFGALALAGSVFSRRRHRGQR